MRDKSKTKTILASALIILAIVTLLTISLTYARYSEEITSSDDRHTGDTEYIVAHQLEVRSVEEFIAAVKNGYSNIKISDEVEDPLVITSGVTDVGADLILDLNGHEIQRNNREPMLNVTEGVRMTIIDSSSSQSGSFYNPVGSVLEISGGTLTVTAGMFESGPRKSEYNSASSDDKIGGSVSASLVTGTYYAKSDTGYTLDETRSMPVITPTVTAMGVDEENKTVWRTNGNIYFDSSVNGYFAADSYIYYTLSDGSTTGLTLGATNNSADFYYTYNVTRNETTGELNYTTASAENENVLTVTIYGYNAVKGRAEPDTGETPNYSAIGMHDGNMYVRGGSYHSWFGSSSAYGLFAEGGYMAVEQGTFEAIENGVCIKCAYAADVDTSAEYLRIARGNFSSEVGDTISVEGGHMIVTGGTFNKDASASSMVNGVAASALTNNAAINMGGGDLTLSNAVFNIEGSGVCGIMSTGSATLSVTAASFDFKSSSGTDTGLEYANARGIYATGGAMTVVDTTFDIASASSYGISAGEETSTVGRTNANVSISGGKFIMSGEASRGVSVSSGEVTLSGGGADQSTPTRFYIDHIKDCYGIYAAGDQLTIVDVGSAEFFLGQTETEYTTNTNQFNGAGVYMNNSASGSTVILGNVKMIAAGYGVSGVYVEHGSVSASDDPEKVVIFTGARFTGYVSGNSAFNTEEGRYSIKDSDGSLSYSLDTIAATNVKDGYGIYAAGDIVINDAFIATYSSYSAGLLTNGGNITVKGDLDVVVEISKNDYMSELSSTAISTEAGDVTLNGVMNNGAIEQTADAVTRIITDSLGITARNGNVNIAGKELKLKSSRGTAIYVNGGTLTIGTQISDVATISSEIDDKTQWVTPPGHEGESTVNNQYDGVYVHGGSLTANGTFNVTHKGLANVEYENVYLVNSSDSSSSVYTIKSFAVRVESTTNSNSEDVVTIKSGTITNSVGGGVSVSGGTLNLGVEGAADGSLNVTTTGTSVGYERSNNGQFYGNWVFCENLTGGSAVEVTGGNLNVYCGTFTAAQGDGIFVKGGNAVINGGSFSGNDAYTSDGLRAGIAASYAFKMYGGEVIVSGGSFKSQGSGAMIIGTSANDMAKATINGGEFIASGQTGFSVYNYADVTFAPGEGKSITVQGVAAGLTVEGIHNGNNSMNYAGSVINISGGTFIGTGQSNLGGGDGIWFDNKHVRMNITGGTIKGEARYGINITSSGNADDGGVLNVSGATVTGSTGQIYDHNFGWILRPEYFPGNRDGYN